MKKMFLVTVVCAMCFSFSSCEEDAEQLPLPDENGYIWLRDVKSLPLIKKTIQGEWRIHYAYGGFTGNGKIDLEDSWFRYLPKDSMYIIFEGDTYAATKPDIVRKQTIFSADDRWVLDFEFVNAWGLRDELMIEMLKGDTLVLVRNAPDDYGYYMTKIK